MGITQWIINLSNSRFARRFQYEPYIIKSVEYIDPKPEDTLLVIYKEADYLKSPIHHFARVKTYEAYEVSSPFELDKLFDKVVLYFSIFDLKADQISLLSDHLKETGRLYSIYYLPGGAFFDLTLKLTDRQAFDNCKKGEDPLRVAGFELEDSLFLKRHHVSVYRYRKGGLNGAEGGEGET